MTAEKKPNVAKAIIFLIAIISIIAIVISFSNLMSAKHDVDVAQDEVAKSSQGQ